MLLNARSRLFNYHQAMNAMLFWDWTPMFYAGGSYNYSNELMELLHNAEHDWPRESTDVIFNGMLVNTTGEEDGYTEGDLRVEQLNDSIKEQAHGVNATPKYLEKVVPAIGVIQDLTKNVYKDLGVEDTISAMPKSVNTKMFFFFLTTSS